MITRRLNELIKYIEELKSYTLDKDKLQLQDDIIYLLRKTKNKICIISN
jgi:hypothetical protein